MNGSLARTLRGKLCIYGLFNPVFLFGSALWSDSPGDIDILLVYRGITPGEVNVERERVAEALAIRLPHYIVDLTTLSTTELRQTGFLSRVPHQLIKC